MNVAVTRARCHVAVVCDSTTVSQNAFLKRLLVHVRKEEEGCVKCADVYLGGGSEAKRGEVVVGQQVATLERA